MLNARIRSEPGYVSIDGDVVAEPRREMVRPAWSAPAVVIPDDQRCEKPDKHPHFLGRPDSSSPRRRAASRSSIQMSASARQSATTNFITQLLHTPYRAPDSLSRESATVNDWVTR